MSEPKTWSENEFIELIEETFREYKSKREARRRRFDCSACAEWIYAALQENGLIQIRQG